MVVDELYYGPQGAAPTDAAALPIDLSKAVQAALERIYRKEIDPEREIDPGLWQGVVDTIDLAAAEGLKRHPGVKYDFKRQLLHNDQVFAAFKVHRLQGDMARQMVDAQGDVKSFEQWAQDVRPIASHQCRQWLRTEYDTAIKRASLAADWQRFEDEKDVLPNLRWVPSTAANPDAFHQSMWDTVLPVDHPFWGAHHPGDRWGCQCALEATDDPVTATPTVNYATSPGLENNPGRDAKLFNDTHPYFPDSCDRCPFHGNHTSGPTNLAKDCYHCEYVRGILPSHSQSTIERRNEIQEQARNDVQGILVSNEAMENILVSRNSIREFLDQPHSHYAEKNELILRIGEVMKEAVYVTSHKPYKQTRKTSRVVQEHFFEINILGDKSWIIVKEYKDGTRILYGISESEKVLLPPQEQ